VKRALALLLAGCGASSASADLSAAIDLGAPICDDSALGDAGLPATLANVQRVFDSICVACHCCGDPLDLTDGNSRAQMVNRVLKSEQGVDETCGGPIVTPGDPSRSYLYQKLHATPCAGNPMPLSEFEFVPLAACEQDVIRRWILDGAPQ
jgi:hypothetical protein